MSWDKSLFTKSLRFGFDMLQYHQLNEETYMSGLANKERAPQSISHNMDGVTPVTHLFDVITGERIDLLEPQISHVDAVMQAERQRGRVDQQPPAAPGVTPTGTGK